jgi:dihydrofolate reductase
VKLSIVAAMSENRVIGRGPDIPWRLPDEQAAVRRLTMGHCLIMGRKTWQTIGRPLPGRTSIVVTRDRDFEAGFDEVIVVHDFESAVEAARAKGDDEAFVFGGEAIYAAALPRADCLYLTRVHATVEGDAHFPDFDPVEWKLRDEAHHPADDRNEHAFTTQRYERA